MKMTTHRIISTKKKSNRKFRGLSFMELLQVLLCSESKIRVLEMEGQEIHALWRGVSSHAHIFLMPLFQVVRHWSFGYTVAFQTCTYSR